MIEKAMYYDLNNGTVVNSYHLGHPEEYETFCGIKKDFDRRVIARYQTGVFGIHCCAECIGILKLIENL